MTSIADGHVCIIAIKCSTAALSACTTIVVRKLCDAEHEAKLKFVHLVPSGGVSFWRNPTYTGSVQVNSFKYLGTMVNTDNSIEEEIKERIAAENRVYHVHKKTIHIKTNIPKRQTTTL
jgi:hypothetical protein